MNLRWPLQLPGRIAKQRSSHHQERFRRGVVNWQYVVDLDDAGGIELPVVG